MKTSHLLAFLGGVVAGGVTALLLAPKSGKETREDIMDMVEDGYGRAKKYVSREGRRVCRSVNKGIDKVSKDIEDGIRTVEDLD